MSQQLLQTFVEPVHWTAGMELTPSAVVEKEVVHERDLLHLSVHLFIVNPAGSILCRKRASNDIRYAGLWTSAIGTHVIAESSYEETLKPLLPQSLQLEFIGEFRVHDEWENEVNGLFVAVADEEDLPDDFLKDRTFLTREKLEQEIHSGGCTPHLASGYELLEKLS